ncbi:MAG: purine-nucleoside phosphorylase [Clostridia bacterium]|nr:purine-nucleoside phosphorylase [Clostridia bacterium]
MSTPHNSAKPGQIAKTVLMPGDPLRAKFIAETFLENTELVSSVRNVYAYTGTYKGKPVSVMASGMGMPSIGIYSYELYRFYDVDNIIRVGSAGGYDKDLALYDIVIADSAYSDSSYAAKQNGDIRKIRFPSEELNKRLFAAADSLGIPFRSGMIHSSDCFYSEDNTAGLEYYLDVLHCLCTEMESFALFHNAELLGKKAACILTISDSVTNDVQTTPQERETAFTNMMKIALEAAIAE